MKIKSIQLFFLLMVINLFVTTAIQSQQRNDTSKTGYRDSLYQMMKEAQKMQKDYKEKMDEENNSSGVTNGIIGVRLDLIFGYTSSNANYETTNSIGGIQTNAKNGGFAGANVTLSLMGFSFTTGLSYSSKGFKTNNGSNFDMNYINLPMLMSFNFNIGKVLIEPSIGPYIGIMLSHDSSSMLKNIDIGVVGNLQGTYMFQKHLGALLGFKYEYGGLNNLSNNSSSQIKSKTWSIYSGVKLIF